MKVDFLLGLGLLGDIANDCCALEGAVNTLPMVLGNADLKALAKVISPLLGSGTLALGRLMPQRKLNCGDKRE